MRRIIVISGPAGVGKTEARRALTQLVPKDQHAYLDSPLCGFMVSGIAVSTLLKSAVEALFDTKFPEPQKDIPQARLFGKKPRDVYKSLYKDYIIPQFGADALGHMIVDEIMEADKVAPIQDKYRMYVIECGVQAEANVIFDRFGADNCLNLSISCEGKTYDGDTRGHVFSPNDANNRYIENNFENLLDYYAYVRDVVDDWLEEEISREKLPIGSSKNVRPSEWLGQCRDYPRFGKSNNRE